MKKLLLTIILICFPLSVLAVNPPVTNGGASTADSGSANVTSLTISNFVVAAGLTNSALIVNTSGGGSSCSGITWNGTENFTSTFGYTRGFRTEAWILVAPTAGTFNIVATCGSATRRMSAQTFTGVKQTSSTGTATTNGLDGITSLFINSTTTVASSLSLDAGSENGGTLTHGTGQTEISNIAPDAGANPSHTDTYHAATSTDSYAMTETISASGSIEMGIYELFAAPAAAAGAGSVTSPLILFDYEELLAKKFI